MCQLLAKDMFSQETLIIRPDFEETRKDPREVVMFKQLKRPKIALILGGGGARGAAHIGAIEALEKNNVPIDLIVGSSMGSVIGGLYAMGYSTAQLRTLVDTTNWNEVLSLTDETSRTNLYMGQKETVDRTLFTLRFDGLSPILPSSVSSGQRLTNFINQLTLYGIYRPAPSFDDLKIPFRSVATDLVSGKRIVMSSGDISEALRASITVPILYSALGRDTLQLVDGGLLSNIPVDIAKSLNADIIIAVDVSSPLRSVDQMNAPWEVADQIIGIMAQLANKQSLAQATIVIKPNLNNHLAGDFSNLRPMIEKGYKATEQVMPSLHDSIRVKETAQYSSGPDASQYAFDVVTLTYREDGAFMPPPELLKVLERIPRVSVGLIKERISRLYATGEFHDVRAEIKIYGNAAAATVSLHSNPIVQEIAISGNAVIPTEEVMKPMRDLQYTRLNSKRVKNGIESLLSLYRDEGYSLARVTAAQFDTVTGTLRINLDEGIVGNISMSGNKKARDWLIRREVVLSRGDVFTVAKAQQSINNIMATNLFEQALIEIRFVDKTPTIVIKTTERRSELIRAGIRADNERGMQPSFQIRDDNFLGTATELGLSSFGGLRNRKFLFEFRANRIFNTYFTFDLNSYYDLRDIYTYRNDPSVSSDTRFKRIQSGEYRRIRYGTSLSLGRQVERLGNFAVEFRVEHNQNRFITGSDGSSDHYTLQALRLRSTVDALDHYPYASSGSLMNLFWETATSQVGGEIGYSKLFFSYEWYNTVNAHHTFHPKFTFGFADETLPLSQQFFLGGEESFFGLRENDSPGRQLFLFNLEYRYLLPFRILWETYAKVRYDFGSIWPAQSNIKIRDLHHGIGVGLGIDTPIGPANLSAGRSFYIRRDVLNEPISYGPMLFYFSVGYQL